MEVDATVIVESRVKCMVLDLVLDPSQPGDAWLLIKGIKKIPSDHSWPLESTTETGDLEDHDM